MSSKVTQARVSARAVVRAAACCSAAGIGLAAAYVAATAVEHASTRARVGGLADAAAQGFSESALRLRADAMSPGAAAIAQRHAPYAGDATASFGGNGREDQIARFTAQLERRAYQGQGQAQLRPAALAYNPAARPFKATGALSGAREMECLTQAVYYESRGDTASGQAAVAQVVLNRVRHPAFPKSVCGVVFQGAQSGSCQFSFTCDGSLSRTRDKGAWRRSQAVAARALAGFVMADVGNATHFHAARIGPQWGGMIRVSQVGLHVFYKFGGRNGAPAVFRQPAPDAKPAPQTVYASILPIMEPPHFGAAADAAKDDAVRPIVLPVAKTAEPVAEPDNTADAKPAPAKPAPTKPAVAHPEAAAADTDKAAT